ncbi:MAG: hypothetical protein QOG87_2982 [Actinomycetota bacterium]
MTRLIGILALTATLALGACGGGSPAAGSTTTTTIDKDKAMLDFAKCMREHGVNMPDPETDGKGGVSIAIEGGPGDEDTLDAAHEACEKYMPKGPMKDLDPEKRQALEDAMVAFARCMRSKGIEMPDPDIGGGGGIKIERKAGQRAPEDDADFQAAETVCRKQHLEQVEKDLGIEGPRRSTGGGPAKGNSSSGGN